MCQARLFTGHCNHTQCPYPDENPQGYQCVEFAEGFCEVGSGCVPQCPHSWPADDADKEQQANEAFIRKYPEIEL